MTDADAIRRATRDDLDAVRTLLARRDARPWTREQVAWSLHDLDPDRCLAWLAFVAGAPVGLTTVFLRRLHVRTPRPAEPLALPAAYWANLYVDPAHRDRMLYPRLPMAMFPTLRKAGVQLLYAAVRRQDVADAHTHIGFARVGTYPVLLKPLRPARLIAKHRHLRRALPLAAPLDAAFSLVRAALRPRPPPRAHAVPADDLPDFAAQLAADPAEVRHLWTPDELAHRYRQTREGTGYERLDLRDGDASVGGLVWRVAERRPDDDAGAANHPAVDPALTIRLGVLLDLAFPPGRSRLLRAALAELERRAHRADCEALLALDTLGPAVRAQLRRAGYLTTRERYTLVAWPKSALATTPTLADPQAWRLPLADHDAF